MKHRLTQLIFMALAAVSYLMFPAYVHGQTQYLDIDLPDSDLRTFISEIEERTDFTFMYSNLDLEQKISVSMSNATIDRILHAALSPAGISYEIVGRKILLKKTSVIRTSLSGTVTDTKDTPLIGAVVTSCNGEESVITDYNGVFTIEITGNDTLKINYLGFKDKSVPIKAGTTGISIELEENSEFLEEIVVVGYGAQRKSSMTAAVTTVKLDDIHDVPTPNVISALQGRVAGLTISETSGQPNSSPSIQIRGIGTIDGATNPLILVDGVPTGTLGLIPANDIASISVLKDAAAASIYGARAANGVILVTTKDGFIEDDKPIISASTYFGLQTAAFSPQTLTAYQYASLLNEVYENEGNEPAFSARDIQMYKNGETDDFHGNTDWKKAVMRNVAPISTTHLSVSGKWKLGHYYVSGEYVNQKGLIKEIDNYDRINFRTNVTSNINRHISIDFTTNYIRTHQEAGDLSYMFREIQIAAPIMPVRYSDGNWGSRIYANGRYLWESGNPAKMVENYGPKGTWWNMLNAAATLNITPVDGLIFKVLFSYRNSWSDSQDYSKSWFSWDPVNQSISQSDDATLTESWDKEYKYDLQATGEYSFSAGNHNFKFLAGYSQESLRSDYITAYRKGFINDSVYELDAGDASTQTNRGGADQWSFASAFGRVNYDYDNRYLFEASFRYDGSSRFAPGHQWGIFPSVSLGWNINRESFLKDVSFIDLLKLRLSWGQLGNAEKVGLYQWFSGVSTGAYYNFDNTLVMGTRPGSIANTDLSWETTT